MRKSMTLIMSLLVGLSLVLSACGPAATTAAPAATDTPAAVAAATDTPAAPAMTDTPAATEAPTAVPPTPTLTPYPIADCQAGKICIRWFVGLGTGTDPSQITVQEGVVKDFNSSQDKVQLILEVVPFAAGRDTLSTEIASGNGPDIVGPVGWGGSNDYYGQWLDIGPEIKKAKFDTSIFDPALVKFYQTEEGQVGLPFAIYPGGMFYVPSMFDESKLSYPPQKYGDKYKMPDGTMVPWNWDTVEKIAKLLTIDKNGKNSTEDGFDPTQIVQVGYNAQWQSPQSWGTFDGGANVVYTGTKKGEYKAAIPATWQAAWKKHYDAEWGKQPWMATGPLSSSPEFGGGNVFNSGKAAMALTQTWYTCCLADFVKAGNQFQVGIMPMSADGVVHGRVDADTFRIWKGTKHPDEAFQVLAYLITTGGDKLLPAYGAMPAIASKTDAFFAKKTADYPFVTPASWDVFKAGTAYPDKPSAEGYMPNYTEGSARIATFGNLMDTTPPDKFNFDTEFKKLEDDLTVIFNK